MNLSSSTILITGGSEGIGLALAERFLKAGSKVIVCGRNQAKLDEVRQAHPELSTMVCDVANEAERVRLFESVTGDFPKLNVVVNNAGIQRRFQLDQPQDWPQIQSEIAINFEAPIHFATLFIAHLAKQENAAILNVTSGLAFVPSAFAPVYGATKAAMHSFTMSLRQNLSKLPIEVIEIIPPAVNTNLGGAGLHDTGVPLAEFADAVFAGLEKGQQEVAYGFSQKSSQASRAELDQVFEQMNRQMS